jgi:hypothetical protein
MVMNKYLCGLILLTGMVLALPVLAQDNEVKADVAISIEQDEDIWAGQQVTLSLDLKTTGFSFSNSHFSLPEVKNAFLMQTDSTTIKLTEKIDGQDWQVVRYPLALYPQAAGQLEIPAFEVRFSTSAGFGSEKKDFEFKTRPMEINVKLPPGANPGDLVVTTTSFELEYSWVPPTGATKTGDAITLTVTRQAGDISAILLPPLPVYRTEGLGAYPKTADVNDKTDRGDLTGERIDSITWVVEKPGAYDIPGIRFQWWDPARRELKQQLIPGLSMDILPSPADASATGAAWGDEQKPDKRLLILLITLSGLFIAALWFRFGRKTDDPQQENEKAAFARLQLACRNNEAAQVHSAIHIWIACATATISANSPPVTLNDFARMFNSDRLATELMGLQEALVASESGWQGDSLLRVLKDIRHEAHLQKSRHSKTYLAPLNP